MVTLKVTYFKNGKPVSINKDAFDGNLLSSNIGEEEATFEFDSLTRIGSHVFDAALKDVEVPSSVTRIEADAFRYVQGKVTASCINEDYLEIVDGVLVACFYRGSSDGWIL